MKTTSADPNRCGPSDDEWNRVWACRCELLNWARITYRYHRKRQKFFDMADKLTQVAAVTGGVAVLGKTVSEYLPWIGGGISLVGLLALVFGYSDKRQCHKEIAERANRLTGDICSLSINALDEKQISVWERVRAEIDLSEPPNLKTLVQKCEWEQAVADGHPNHTKEPRWWQQAHMHFF
jgi:hypothetical protein